LRNRVADKSSSKSRYNNSETKYSPVWDSITRQTKQIMNQLNGNEVSQFTQMN